MTTNNRVSVEFSAEDQKAILDAIALIRQKLPFLVGLTADERRALPRLGDKSRAFVARALEIAGQNPDFLPRTFEVQEMRRDVELFEKLYPIALSLRQLDELLEDTTTVVGAEAYGAALTVYNFGRYSGKGLGLDGALDEMGRRFARKARCSEPAAPTV